MTRAPTTIPSTSAPRCNDLARELVPEHLARLDQRAVEIDVQVRADRSPQALTSSTTSRSPRSGSGASSSSILRTPLKTPTRTSRV